MSCLRKKTILEARSFHMKRFLSTPNSLPHHLIFKTLLCKTWPFRRLLFNFSDHIWKYYHILQRENEQLPTKRGRCCPSLLNRKTLRWRHKMQVLGRTKKNYIQAAFQYTFFLSVRMSKKPDDCSTYLLRMPDLTLYTTFLSRHLLYTVHI